jgi:hypothetical protein
VSWLTVRVFLVSNRGVRIGMSTRVDPGDPGRKLSTQLDPGWKMIDPVGPGSTRLRPRSNTGFSASVFYTSTARVAAAPAMFRSERDLLVLLRSASG